MSNDVAPRPMMFVEDNEAEILLASNCYARAALSAPWMTSTGGSECLAYLGQVKEGIVPMPIAVVLDLNMPGINGFDVLSWIRSDTFFDDLRVVIFTNSDNRRDRQRSLALGATDFVVKPYCVDHYVDLFKSLIPDRVPQPDR